MSDTAVARPNGASDQDGAGAAEHLAAFLVREIGAAERQGGESAVVISAEVALDLVQLLRGRPVLRSRSEAQRLADARRQFMQLHGMWPPEGDLGDLVFLAIGWGFYA